MSKQLPDISDNESGIRLDISRDEWLSEICQFPCYNGIPGTGNIESDMVSPTDRYLITARADEKNTVLSSALENAGFLQVETSITLALWPESTRMETRTKETAEVVESRPEEAEQVAKVAAEAFQMSRFHQDLNFPRETARQLKSEWARNLASGLRGDKCLVVKDRGNVVGFLGYKYEKVMDPTMRIDLIAVHPKWQGRGFAQLLVADFLDRARQSTKKAVVGTQINNGASLRLYEHFGFRREAQGRTFHLWGGDGVGCS